jgi:hypothetical protein
MFAVNTSMDEQNTYESHLGGISFDEQYLNPKDIQ